MVEAKTYMCILACVVGIVHGQFVFPGASTADADSGSTSSSSGTPKPASADEPSQDAPQGNPGQTRLFGLDGLLGTVFGNECDRCTPRDQVLANRCCQQGQRHCCRFLQPVVGFARPPVGPGFPGQVGGGFQPGSGSFQPGPPGFIPGGTNSGLISGSGLSGGRKPGICQDGSSGVQSGFNQFAGGQCVQQCRSDGQCSGIQKCCNVGCSTACQTPRGVGGQGFQGNGFQQGGFQQGGFQQGGFQPGGFQQGGFQQGGFQQGGFQQGGFQQGGGFPTGGGFGGGGFGGGGFVQPTNKPGFCQRKINPITDPIGALSSVLGLRSGISADDPTAAAGQEEKTDSRSRRFAHNDEDEDMKHERSGLTRSSKPKNRLVRQSGGDPNTRFFGPFCKDRCFNDFDCPGSLKCCSGQLDDCRKCDNPQFF